MIELSVEAAEGFSEDQLLSARLGTARQQVSVVKALSRPLVFRAPLSPEVPVNVRLDILQRVGSSWVVALPGQEHYSVPFNDKSGGKRNLSLRLTSSQEPAQCLTAGASRAFEELQDVSHRLGDESRRPSTAQSAKDYLERHKVLSFVHSLLHAVILEQPADPFAFMAQQLPRGPADAAERLRTKDIEALRRENSRLRADVERLRAENKDLKRGVFPDQDELGDTLTRSRSGTRGSSREMLRRPTIDVDPTAAGIVSDHEAFRTNSPVTSTLTRCITRKALAVNAFTALGERNATDQRIKEGLEEFWRRLQGMGNPADEFRLLRQSVLTGRWTLYSAGGKNSKPHQYSAERQQPRITDQPEHNSRCPFCTGNEHKTPDPILAFGSNGEIYEGTCPENWLVRVIPNIFPLFVTPHGAYGDTFESKLECIPHSPAARGYHNNEILKSDDVDLSTSSRVYRQIDAVGFSEVVIENPQHNGLLAIVNHKQVALGLRALQMRGKALVQEPGVRQLLYFKQYGSLSGGSLVHPHMQIVTLPLLTPETQNRIHRAHAFLDSVGVCSVCHCFRDDPLGQGTASCRMLHESKHFVAVMPFASNQYRVTIAPKVHAPSWLGISQEEVEDMAYILQLVMEGLWHCLDDPDYDVTIFSVDKEEELPDGSDAVHWVLDIHPRFAAEQGGIEIASGIRVMSGLPEDWAQNLRKAIDERLALRHELNPPDED